MAGAYAPAALAQGLGRRLFEACRDAALQVGAGRLEIYASLNAVAFYARLRFAPVADFAIPLTPNLAFPAVRRTLDAGG